VSAHLPKCGILEFECLPTFPSARILEFEVAAALLIFPAAIILEVYISETWVLLAQISVALLLSGFDVCLKAGNICHF